MANPKQEAERQAGILCEGAEEVISRAGLEAKLEAALKAGRPLRVKLGMDPSSPDLHIGHAVVLRKLRQFQDLGHTAILLVGDFTASIGDPTGRNKTRPPLSEEDIVRNARTYQDQAGVWLDLSKVDLRRNSEWCRPLGFADVIKLAQKTTVARILERDDFQKRYQGGVPIHLHEILYPLVQAYDSVVLKADVELCGTDQKFNCLMGRALQEQEGQEPEIILITGLLVGMDGVNKMSKSLGNSVNLKDSPDQMFGKLMSIPDSLMPDYLRLAAFWPGAKAAEAEKALKEGRLHPMELKKNLARDVVARYAGTAAAAEAQAGFEKVFSKGELPVDMPVVEVAARDWNPVDLLLAAGLVESKSEARRAIEANSVSVDGEKLTDPTASLALSGSRVLKVGKRKFVRLRTPQQ